MRFFLYKVAMKTTLFTLFLAFTATSAQAFTYVSGHRPTERNRLQCGAVLTQNTSLSHDLDCRGMGGYALSVQGNGITLKGNGHTIFADAANAGLYIQGSDVTVTSVRVSGVKFGYGIYAYDSPNLKLVNNRLIGNQTGILLAAENTTMSGLDIHHNESSHNSEFGLRTTQTGSGTIVNPKITCNDFSFSGSYAIYLQAEKAKLNRFSDNKLNSSNNGIYLKDGDFVIKDLSFKRADIRKAAIFADHARSVKITRVDASNNLAPNPNDEHTAVSLYEVRSIQINKLVADNQDIGVLIATNQDQSSYGRIRHSSFVNNTVAGICLRSIDGTPYQGLVISRNEFDEKTNDLEIVNQAKAPLEIDQRSGVVTLF